MRVGSAATTYRELGEASARVAGLLRERGLNPGDRVAIMLPDVAEFPMLYYGTLRAGGVAVPMNPLLKAREVAYHLGDSGARMIFAWRPVAREASDGAEQADAQAVGVDPADFKNVLAATIPEHGLADRDDQDTAVVLYTSGTTGQPKGAELTHANLASNATAVRADIIRPRPDDVIFGGLPLFHAFGQTCTLNVAVASGTCLTLLPRFTPGQALEIFADHRVTVFAGVPTMYIEILAHGKHAGYDTGALRLCLSGGAAMPVPVLRDFECAFDCQVLEGYGLSETSPVASFNFPEQAKPGTVGMPIPGVQMRVVDENGHDVGHGEVGEIAIRGPNVMKGYWHRPGETAGAIRDGWLHTGDLGRVDEDGRFTIVGRTKDVIIRSGYNVYPREIEQALEQHPAVAEAAVIGLPDRVRGEEVAAAVVLKPGCTVTPEELRDYVKAQVAAYKYPRHVWIVSALPKGPTGKTLKREIAPPAGLAGR